MNATAIYDIVLIFCASERSPWEYLHCSVDFQLCRAVMFLCVFWLLLLCVLINYISCIVMPIDNMNTLNTLVSYLDIKLRFRPISVLPQWYSQLQGNNHFSNRGYGRDYFVMQYT